MTGVGKYYLHGGDRGMVNRAMILTKFRIQPKRQFLSGSVDQVGTDLQEVERIGVDHFILNYNRSVISDNTDKIIEVSKELSGFIT
jgi:hypothetical protein